MIRTFREDAHLHAPQNAVINQKEEIDYIDDYHNIVINNRYLEEVAKGRDARKNFSI